MSDTAFDRAAAHLFKIEGKYADHPDDRGGRTMYGVTESVARAAGYRGEMKDLSPDQARTIAKERYWDAQRLTEVARLCEPLAAEMFEAGYLMHPIWPGRFLQRCLNVFNRGGKQYPELYVDGLVGPATLTALSQFLTQRGLEGAGVLTAALDQLQGARLIGIAERDPSQRAFAYGWMRARTYNAPVPPTT